MAREAFRRYLTKVDERTGRKPTRREKGIRALLPVTRFPDDARAGADPAKGGIDHSS